MITAMAKANLPKGDKENLQQLQGQAIAKGEPIKAQRIQRAIQKVSKESDKKD